MPISETGIIWDEEGIVWDSESIGNSQKANEDLLNGLMYNAAPEQVEAITTILNPEDEERLTYSNWTNTRYGTNLPPEAIEANLKYEFGEDATYAQANASN